MLKHMIVILALFFQVSTVFANPHPKVILHTNDTFKLGHLKNSVNNIRREMGNGVEIKVVINGKAVQSMLKNNESSTELVNDILQQNVKIGLCHNALTNNQVTKDMLIKGLDVLPQDGNVAIIDLQKKGYFYIKI